MANVWKIGSRWSEKGTLDSRIISIFRRSGVVFLGTKDAAKFKNDVKEGDYFAIADGYKVPAVARAISDPVPLNDLKKRIKVRPDDPFDLSWNLSGGYGVRVKIVDLPADSTLYYKNRRAFCNAYDIWSEVKRLYEEGLNSQKFDIKAKTYRVLATRGQKDGKDSIIDKHTFYNIPVYQREYSWGRDQVARFIVDIFKGFWGAEEEKVIKEEPMFIGTMQLSYKKYINQEEYEQDIIDGQQRISTIVCLLKYLKLIYPENKRLVSIKLDWLETRVNNGKEDSYLNDMLRLKKIEDAQNIKDLDYNRYRNNIIIIDEVIKDITTDENDKKNPLFEESIDRFIDYILNDIYFVVVETVAGLSRTIQIFNTINTAGLDLSGNDLFKVRFYEYLHDKLNLGEDAFNEIGEIYKDVKERNVEWRKHHGSDAVSLSTILSIYKYYLISKYQLPVNLYDKSVDTFFEELFDVLLNVQEHKEYKNLKDLTLSLADLRRMVDVAFMWSTREFRSTDEYITCTIISRSRYSKYGNIAYQILLSNEDKPYDERLDEVYACMRLLSRIFFCWSLKFHKAVYYIHKLMHNEVYRLVAEYKDNKDSLFEKLSKTLMADNTDDFREKTIGKVIADNRTWKDLVCVLSGYLYELDPKLDPKKLKESISDLFSGDYDIEHIHANANTEECTDISSELQNSIGNLMVLESSINRSIGNKTFREKKNRPGYVDSHFAVVKDICNHDDWLLDDVKQRRKNEIVKISDFLFNKI